MLTAPEVVAAMQDHQLPTHGVEVRLSVPATSTVAHPALEIQAITPLNQHDVRLRVACQDRSQCLPFFAIASYPEAIASIDFQAQVDHQTTVTQKSLAEAKAAPEGSLPSAPHKPLNPGTPPVMRSGSPATLDFDEQRLHVRIEVICLESGATGDKIRVTTRDHKQVYTAEIVAPNALKGILIR